MGWAAAMSYHPAHCICGRLEDGSSNGSRGSDHTLLPPSNAGRELPSGRGDRAKLYTDRTLHGLHCTHTVSDWLVVPPAYPTGTEQQPTVGRGCNSVTVVWVRCAMALSAVPAASASSVPRQCSCRPTRPSKCSAEATLPTCRVVSLNGASSSHMPMCQLMVSALRAPMVNGGQREGRVTPEVICPDFFHAIETMDNAGIVAVGLGSAHSMVMTRQRSQERHRARPKSNVSACGGQSRCVINLKLLWWSGVRSSFVMICLG